MAKAKLQLVAERKAMEYLFTHPITDQSYDEFKNNLEGYYLEHINSIWGAFESADTGELMFSYVEDLKYKFMEMGKIGFNL